MKRLIPLSVLALCFALIAVGCAKPPAKEMEAAKASIDAAIQAEADKYAPDELNAAKKAFDDGKAAVEAKNYKSAKNLFIEAKDSADRAIEAAKANKEKVEAEVQELIPEVEKIFNEANRKVRTVPRYPRSRYRKLGIKAKKALLDSLEGVLVSAKADFDSARYYESKMKLTDVKAKSQEIIDSIKGKK